MKNQRDITLHSGGISQAVTIEVVECSVGECRICSSPTQVVRGQYKYTLRARQVGHTAWACAKKKCREKLLQKLVKLLARDTQYSKKQIRMMLRQP